MALALAGCGGSSDSSTPTPQSKTGVFLDSPVIGMNYRTATISDGVTTEGGKFTYLEGETVTFYLGDLTFPAVKAGAQVTPADIGGGLATTTTVNILQLLQSLDNEGNLSDGITIPKDDASINTFEGIGLLDITDASFDTDASAILTSIGKTLVTEEAAQAHFTDTLKGQLTGSWLLSEGAGKRNVLTFFNDNNYIIVHEHSDIPDDGDQPAGSAEYGTYTYDPATQMLALNVISESDNSGGLADDFGSITLEVQATQTTLDITFADEAGEQVQFSKITDSSNAMVGAWYLREDDISSDNILTILPNNQYVIVHSNNQEAYNGEAVMATSGEFGSFSLNGGVFTVTSITSEADGPGGLYDQDSPMFSATVTVTDNESLNFTNSDENFTFSRIK
ncbi:TPA: adhesin [Vibrio vulnificus]|nr:adhesin [Vibrio vulnificus]